MKRILMTVAATALVPAAALAQEGQAADENKPITRAAISAELDSDYADLDSNKDGKVTSAELSARLQKSAEAKVEIYRKERDAAFARLDANGDGTVSRAEFDEKAKLPTIKDQDIKPFLTRFDSNKDGLISKEEFRAPTLANFDKADKNKDGTVSVSERTALAAPQKTAPKPTPPIGR